MRGLSLGLIYFRHFEQVCRDWALHDADPELLGGLPARVGHGVVHDPKARTGHETDVAVIDIAEGSKPPLPHAATADHGNTPSLNPAPLRSSLV
ncbi:hypothetical protein [Streptomyces lutosisoli]|uniref:Uncharacterized protein n=1 Tax=Streptomyces lutosisoli TaxID=2665721 RepID=A0ABW2VJB3_9ACTN